MEDFQLLLHDPNCSDDVIDHIFNDMVIEKNQKLENILKDISVRKSEIKKMGFKLSLKVKCCDNGVAITDAVFAVNPEFNFSREDVHQLAHLISLNKDAFDCLSQFVGFFHCDFDETVDLQSYPFYAFIFATLMLREKETYSLHNLVRGSSTLPLRERAFEVYSLLKNEMLGSS
jgi:hypothetical protein